MRYSQLRGTSKGLALEVVGMFEAVVWVVGMIGAGQLLEVVVVVVVVMDDTAVGLADDVS